MNGSTLARVERHAETPLLPLHERLFSDAEGRTFRLDDVQRLQILTCTTGKQLRHIVRVFAVTNDVSFEGLLCQTFSLTTCGGTVDPNDLLGKRIHNRDERQRVGVEVGVWVVLALIGGKAQTLEVPALLLNVVQSTIWPRLDDDLEALGEVEVGQSLLEERGGEATLDQGIKLAPRDIALVFTHPKGYLR